MNLSSAPGSLFLSGCLKHKRAGGDSGFNVLHMVNQHPRTQSSLHQRQIEGHFARTVP